MDEKKIGRPINPEAKYVTKNGKTEYKSAVKARQKYITNNYDKVTVYLPKNLKEKIAEKLGKPASTFMKECTLEKLEELGIDIASDFDE